MSTYTVDNYKNVWTTRKSDKFRKLKNRGVGMRTLCVNMNLDLQQYYRSSELSRDTITPTRWLLHSSNRSVDCELSKRCLATSTCGSSHHNDRSSYWTLSRTTITIYPLRKQIIFVTRNISVYIYISQENCQKL